MPAPLNACAGGELAWAGGTHSIWKADGFPYRTIVDFYGACSAASVDGSSPISSSISRCHSRDSQGRRNP